MEAFAAFVLGLGMIAAAQDAAYAPYRAGHGYYYAAPATYADTGYRPAYVYAPAAPAIGAVTGGAIGAAAGGVPGLVLGAAVGGVTGDVIATPRVLPVARAGFAPAYEPASSTHSGEATDQYIRRWQSFIEPASKR